MSHTENILPEIIRIKDNRYLNIVWRDGSESLILLSSLRKACPCASCRNERETRKANYIPVYTENQFMVSNIRIVGNYAIQIFWRDGHNTGIYSYDKLRTNNYTG